MVDDKPIWNVIAGRIGFCAIVVAHELELFECLKNDAKSISELSITMGLDERPVEALSLMLVNLGFLDFKDDKFKLSDCSKKYLLKSSETYFGGMLELSNKYNWSCEDLKQSAILNKPQIYNGEDVFKTHHEAIQRAEKFTYAMHSASMASAQHWPNYVDLSKYTTLIDIGGGSGAHIIGALNKWHHLQAVLLEIPSVCNIAEKILSKYEIHNRINIISDDFWTCTFPPADVHFYSQIFHDWPAEKCKVLAKRSYDSLPASGLIIVHEILFDDDKKGPYMASAGNVGMLPWTEGKQYSGYEIKKILIDSGFKSIQVIPTFGYWSIVLGVK